MIPLDDLILLDTNIILQFIRKNMTTDDDFDHLHPKYIQRIKIDAKTGKTIASAFFGSFQ